MGTAKYFREVLGVDFGIDEMLSLMDEYALPKYRDEIQLKDRVYDDSAKDFCEQLKTVSDLYVLSFDGLEII